MNWLDVSRRKTETKIGEYSRRGYIVDMEAAVFERGVERDHVGQLRYSHSRHTHTEKHKHTSHLGFMKHRRDRRTRDTENGYERYKYPVHLHNSLTIVNTTWHTTYSTDKCEYTQFDTSTGVLEASDEMWTLIQSTQISNRPLSHSSLSLSLSSMNQLAQTHTLNRFVCVCRFVQTYI